MRDDGDGCDRAVGAQLATAPRPGTQEPLPNIETLQDDGEFFVFRTVRDGEPFIVVRPVADVAAASVARMENALALRADLDAAWAARPSRLERWQGRPALFLEDPGGELPARKVGQPLQPTPPLRGARGAAPR